MFDKESQFSKQKLHLLPGGNLATAFTIATEIHMGKETA